MEIREMQNELHMVFIDLEKAGSLEVFEGAGCA